MDKAHDALLPFHCIGNMGLCCIFSIIHQNEFYSWVEYNKQSQDQREEVILIFLSLLSISDAAP